MPEYIISYQYAVHTDVETRNSSGIPDLGAFGCNESLSVKEISLESRVTIYPNPTNDKVLIKSNILKPAVIFIYNAIWQEVIIHKFNKNIDLSHEDKGIYLLKIIDKNGREI